jgi:hypothetical protein
MSKGHSRAQGQGAAPAAVAGRERRERREPPVPLSGSHCPAPVPSLPSPLPPPACCLSPCCPPRWPLCRSSSRPVPATRGWAPAAFPLHTHRQPPLRAYRRVSVSCVVCVWCVPLPLPWRGAAAVLCSALHGDQPPPTPAQPTTTGRRRAEGQKETERRQQRADTATGGQSGAEQTSHPLHPLRQERASQPQPWEARQGKARRGGGKATRQPRGHNGKATVTAAAAACWGVASACAWRTNPLRIGVRHASFAS